ncbi:MAG: hypothetical protein JST12_04050 [Armatimonadetes bacterium]|nr:hypothetical protein [Armatimonadota bacterium]
MVQTPVPRDHDHKEREVMNIAFNLATAAVSLKSFLVATLPWGTLAIALLFADNVYSRRNDS